MYKYYTYSTCQRPVLGIQVQNYVHGFQQRDVIGSYIWHRSHAERWDRGRCAVPRVSC
jgi:hypothetical protein